MLIFVLVVCALDAYAIGHTMLRLYQREEMVAGNYTAFCKDNDGYVWIGTDIGLLRFDGNHSEVFRYDERNDCSISDNRVLNLYCDRGGDLWIGTADGLNFFDRREYKFHRIKLPGFDLNGFIGDIDEIDDGRIVFVVSGVGLFTVRREDDEFVVDRLRRGFDGEREVGKVLNLGDGSLLLAGRSSNILKMNRHGDLSVACVLERGPIRMEAETPNSVLFATKFGVYRYNLDTRDVQKLRVAGDEDISILDLHSSGDGLTYLATAGSGLWEIKEGSAVIERANKFYFSDLEIEKIKINCVYKDDEGNIWLGCNHKGVGFASAKQLPFISKKLSRINEGISGEISCMDIVGDCLLAALTDGKMLVMDIDGNFLKQINAPGGNIVTCVTAETRNTALVGTLRDGIYRLHLDNFRLEKVTDIDDPYAGLIMQVADNGDVIAAVGALGVFRLDAKTGQKEWFKSSPGSSTLNGLYYAGISKTRDGRIWIGGYSGLSCYDSEAGALVNIDQTPFLNLTVYSACDGPDGTVMLATSRGLLQYRLGQGVVKAYTMVHGLHDIDVRTVATDPKGGVWVAGMNGLSYLAPGAEGLQTFSSYMGLSEKSYVFSGVYPRGNRLILGGYEGLTILNHDSVPMAEFDGEVKVSGLYLNGSRINPSMMFDDSTPIIEGSETSPDALHLSYKDKALVISLSTMDFRNTSLLRYEWQMSGDGDIWNSTQPGESYIYVPSLDPGVYKLRIRGWDDNVCSDVKELTVNISKPWYQSNMAYAALVFLVLSIIALFYKVVKSRKEEEMNEAKIKFFMDISHEIRSPIMLLLNPVDALLKQQQTPEATSQLLTVRRNAQRVLGLADQLLDIQKVEKGKMRLVYQSTDLQAFVGELVEMFQSQAKSKSQVLTFECDEKPIECQVDRDNLDKILVNLISNALKYTPAGGVIKVELSTLSAADGKRSYRITVTDTGIGLDNKLLSHLFDRFYRNRERHHTYTTGFGIGLDLCMRLVGLLNGTITGQNREDGVKGSVFTVTLPLLKDAPVATNASPKKVEPEADNWSKEDRLAYFLPDAVGQTDADKPKKYSSKGHVMIIDDDAELLAYLERNLGRSYHVTTYLNAEDALRALAEKHPDIIISDVRMKGISGLEFLKRVKSNVATHHIPIILFSSDNDQSERSKGWRSGADGYIAKPFSIDEIDSMIRGMISTRQKLKGKYSGVQETQSQIELPKPISIKNDLMVKIDKYINENLSEPDLNVDTLSECVGLSRSQIYRKMRDIAQRLHQKRKDAQSLPAAARQRPRRIAGGVLAGLQRAVSFLDFV